MNNFDYLKVTRDQVIFVGSFFSIFGLIMTDSYYTVFGIKYQFLQLTATHIIYRGFTLIYFDPFFTIVFLVIIVGIAVSQFRFKLRIGSKMVPGTSMLYWRGL
jgi:hypothetical protein